MTALEIRCLPAQQGDALWVLWGEGHQLFIDMGTERTGSAIATRLSALPPDQRVFDLLVITHVDSDHIGGVLTCLTDQKRELPGLTFRDVWFNGWEHLHGKSVPPPNAPSLEPMGPAQGERLAGWLRDKPWNTAFDRGPVVREATYLPTRTLEGGLTLTVLGPTPQRLENLQTTWKDEVDAALEKKSRRKTIAPGVGDTTRRMESYGPKTPPILDSKVDLEILAESPGTEDPSLTNASSIALLLTWQGRNVLLAGDAHADDLVAALGLHGNGTPVALDVFKLPHHGSRNNVSRALVEAVDCPYWLFSTDGTQFRHPDAIAVARVLRWRRQARPTLGFNVHSTYNGWWNSEAWRELFDYEVSYGDYVNGLTITLAPR